MKIRTITNLACGVVLATGLAATLAHAQTAGQDMKDAGHATKDAAVDTGHATEKVAHKTARGTKHVAKKTANGTKHVAKETGRRTANAGDALAGKPEEH